MKESTVLLVVLSEFVLGLYSRLIKSVPTTLSTQVLVRMIMYTFGSLISAQTTSNQKINPSLTHLLSMGLLNTVHIGSSYYAFKTLPSATSLSLFYTYPFFNILFSTLLLHEKFHYPALPWLALSFIGALFVILPASDSPINHDTRGIAAIFVSALTESLIYIAFRSKYEPNHNQGIFHLYGGGLIATLAARLSNVVEPFDYSLQTWTPLVLFNLFIGYLSSSTIFKAIPEIPVELFAALAFFGVISGFIFGELGGEAKPEIPTYIGATAIVLSAAAIRLLKIEKA
ncbi:MAG: DMT family transporter [Gammaproteobacteria bacterium]|nr:DMT family transporter [Gammaproteobacteria bacterium]